MHFYPHVESCYRKGQVLSLTNELISTKFELVKFFKRLFSIIVFIFEVFETWAESKMSMLPGNEKSLLLVLLTVVVLLIELIGTIAASIDFTCFILYPINLNKKC